jgi:hypothetical protein
MIAQTFIALLLLMGLSLAPPAEYRGSHTIGTKKTLLSPAPPVEKGGAIEVRSTF